MAAIQTDPTRIDAVVDGAIDEYRLKFIDPRWQDSLSLHPPRYRFLMALVMSLVDRLQTGERQQLKILDVGPRFEVDLIHRLKPDLRVDTLGIDPGFFEPRVGEQRLIFDLNDADFPERRPNIGQYPLIVMAEVLEHLYLPPSVTIGWVGSLLEPGGYLVVQTPNAVSLPNRLRMLVGKNPFQPLTAERAYPGHKREYTVSELRREGRALGLQIDSLRTANYFASRTPMNRAYRRLERIVPKTLRSGITVVYRRPAS